MTGSADCITIGRASTSLAKHVSPSGGVVASANASEFQFLVRRVSGLEDLETLLVRLAGKPTMCVFRDRPAGTLGAWVPRIGAADRGDERTLLPCARLWFALDLDAVVESAAGAFVASPGDEIARVVASMPRAFRGCGYVWQCTGSAGFKPGIRARLWFWLDQSLESAALKRVVRAGLGSGSGFDASVFDAARIIFTADPVLEGVDDPLVGRRIGRVDGRVVVASELMALVPEAELARDGATEQVAAPDLSRLHPIARKAVGDAAERVVALSCKRIRRLRPDDEWNNTVNECAYVAGKMAWLVGGPEAVEKRIAAAIMALNDPTFDASAFRTAAGAVAAGAAAPELPTGVRGVENARFVVPESAEPGRALMAELAGYMAEYDTELFVRGGMVVRVAGGEIQELSVAALHEHLESYVRVQKTTVRGDRVAESLGMPPRDWAEKLHGRGDWPGMRGLEGVVSAPVLRADGTLLDVPGWDADTGLWYQPRAGWAERVVVPASPTRLDGQKAVARLLDLVQDFPFATSRDRSAAVAFALTLAGRSAIVGPTPLFCFDAATPGSGKGLLVKVLAAAAGLDSVALGAWSATEEEREKRVVSALLAGRRLMVMDEVSREISSDVVRTVTTEPWYEARRLGVSEVRRLSTRMVMAVAGNNLTPGRDMPRRMCRIRLVADCARPEGRSGFKYTDVDVVAQDPRYLTACLTALRAYRAAGSPGVGELPNRSSYGAWADVVRACLVWLGLGDPIEGLIEEMHAEQPGEVGDSELIELLAAEMGDREFTGADVWALVSGNFGPESELQTCIYGLLHRDRRNAAGVGYLLRKMRDRILPSGLVLRPGPYGMCGTKWRIRRTRTTK